MLIAKNIEKSYGSNRVLRGVELCVRNGEFLSIMGESGSGKSTLLSVLSGNLRPDSGQVLLGGRNLHSLSEKDLAQLRRTEIGFVYQSLNLIPTLRADENILLPLYLDRANIGQGKKKMSELAERMGIQHVLRSFPDQMSGGERQRVAIARALLHAPSLLFLDEPTGSLDSTATKQVMSLLKELNRETGIGMIQVTHSEDAARYGTRMIRFHDGRITGDETVL